MSSFRYALLTAVAVGVGACSAEVDFSGTPNEDKAATAEPRNCEEARTKLAAANEEVAKTGTAYLNADGPTRDQALRGHIDAKVVHLEALLAVNTLCPQ